VIPAQKPWSLVVSTGAFLFDFDHLQIFTLKMRRTPEALKQLTHGLLDLQAEVRSLEREIKRQTRHLALIQKALAPRDDRPKQKKLDA